MRLSRVIYTLLVFIALWSAYYLFDKEQANNAQIAPNAELPMFTGDNIVNDSYGDKGVLSYIITSKHLEYYQKSGDTYFDHPVLKIYRNGKVQEWQVTADKGILDKDHVLKLEQNVLAKNLLPKSAFDTFSTAELYIQVVKRDFWTETPVTMVGPQFRTVGQAMKGNFADHNAVLYNNVQGRYENLTR
ncbi:LPS export ABC transporter periplasmic protein LptC [Vibrio marisflavi]|uniref:Lipopolysaccharide export system protein LptC n=1 Tax=Vibrio marisflavi CECT 7928 TaxID=634439 RepID=A0ABM9A238_9VIBR|nr:LPS export ABC transporter periplasmic protein LptC [Vibrio marisflavi]CAH0538488.1 Lipopolysaccharide export system protein LptC [Vibrio marisflavi CECT 7928]